MNANDLICSMSLMKEAWAGNSAFYALNMGINVLSGDHLFGLFYFLHLPRLVCTLDATPPNSQCRLFSATQQCVLCRAENSRIQ